MMTSHENQEYFHGLERNPYETSDVYFIRHDKSSADDDRLFEWKIDKAEQIGIDPPTALEDILTG